MGEFVYVTDSGAQQFWNTYSELSGPVAHVGAYLGPWPMHPPPTLVNLESGVQFILAVPGSDPEDPNLVSAANNPRFYCTVRRWANLGSATPSDANEIVDYIVRDAGAGDYSGIPLPDTQPDGLHLYVRVQGALVDGTTNTFNGPVYDPGDYVPRNYAAAGTLSFQAKPPKEVQRVPPAQSTYQQAQTAGLVKYQYTHPAGEQTLFDHVHTACEYVANEIVADTALPINYLANLNATAPNADGVRLRAEATYDDATGLTAIGFVQYAQFIWNFPAPDPQPVAGIPPDFADRVSQGDIIAHRPDGSPSWQWTPGDLTSGGYTGVFNSNLVLTETINTNNPDGTVTKVQAFNQLKTYLRGSSPALAAPPTAWFGDGAPIVSTVHLDNPDPSGVVQVNGGLGVTDIGDTNPSLYFYLRFDGITMPLGDKTSPNSIGPDLSAPDTAFVMLVEPVYVGSAEYLVGYPAYGTVTTDGVIFADSGPGRGRLRLTQRSDGLGIYAHPRLMASAGGAPNTLLRAASPRLGTNNRPQ